MYVLTVITILHYLHIRELAITDENSFVEFDKGMTSANPLDFPGYQEKLKKTNKN